MGETKALPRRHVVTAFLRHQGKILLLRRSGCVGSYRGRWAGVSGYLEATTALAQAQREIREETGLRDDASRLVRETPPLEVPAPEMGTCWVVHPFLFDVDDPGTIRLDWEHLEMQWVDPEALGRYHTVPALEEALAAGRPTPRQPSWPLLRMRYDRRHNMLGRSSARARPSSPTASARPSWRCSQGYRTVMCG